MKRMAIDKYIIQPLVLADAEQALQFACREFVTESPVHRVVGVAYDEYLSYLRAPFMTMAAEGLSFVAVDTESAELAGCVLAGDFCPETNAPLSEELQYDEPHDEVPESMRAIKALLNELERPYKQSVSNSSDEILIVDIAAVNRAARGQGLYRRLRLSAQGAAKERGFSRVVGELSSAATQRFCVEKLGHKIINEVAYKTFRFNDTLPFASIEHPSTLQLVEGVL
jgi:hypothetical protein